MCRIKVRAAVSAIAILILPLLAAAAHRPAVQVAAGSIAGSVRSNGSSVANATVNVWRDGKQIASVAVTADRFGFFRPERTYQVQASSPPYRTQGAPPITVG